MGNKQVFVARNEELLENDVTNRTYILGVYDTKEKAMQALLECWEEDSAELEPEMLAEFERTDMHYGFTMSDGYSTYTYDYIAFNMNE